MVILTVVFGIESSFPKPGTLVKIRPLIDHNGREIKSIAVSQNIPKYSILNEYGIVFSRHRK